jgi:putative heme-binding domain-containing protein
MKRGRFVIFVFAAVWLLGWGLLDSTVLAQSLTDTLKAEGAASLAGAARERGNAVHGAILFPQQIIGCANCHATGGQDLLGPDLREMGPEATDIYLAEAMLYPSKVIKKGFETVTVITGSGKSYVGRVIDKTGDKVVLRLVEADRRLITWSKDEIEEIVPNAKSAMPDALVDQFKDRQQFLDILKYMMEIKAAGPRRHSGRSTPLAGGRHLDIQLQGLVLLDDFKCAACHGDMAVKTSVSSKHAPRLAWSAGRVDPNYIERFIAAPSQVKPGTTMPDAMVGLDAAARRSTAEEITHFLVSVGRNADREAKFQPQPLDQAAAQRGRALFHSVGCVACHSPRGEDGVERLTEKSVPLGAIERKYNINGLVAFLEDPHAVRPSGRMPNMQLSHWEAIEIANFLLFKPGGNSAPVSSFRLDRALAEKGKTQFHRLGCAQCHTAVSPKSQSGNSRQAPYVDVPSFADSSFTPARTDRGCLSENVGRWPRYDLDEQQRGAMRAALLREPTELTNEQQIALTLATFNCVACHQRGEMGGVSSERDEYFHTTNPNLGPQGRIPPPLTNVGAKLNSKWMRQVLVSGRTIRPYLLTRMPQYGTDNVAHLIDLFQHVDQLPEIAVAKFTDLKLMRNSGAELAGNGGLNCIACHTFQQKPAATMSAVDLTEMAERLQKNWFHHYMLDPQRLSANTVMPSFWPGGRAIRKGILDGKTDLQVEAMWQYLLDGRQARTPRGLIRKPIELVATDEAVMLRRSYQGIGKRGIGVGYPNQVNLAFDAEQMRLAMIWKGKFADPGGVWRSQGHGSVRPLGTNLIRFAPGPDLDDAVQPWRVEDGRPRLHQFKGYDLDSLQRPILKYRFDTIDVEDYSIDVKDEASGAVLIRRTLTFTSQKVRPDVVFRAATGPSIVSEGHGNFLVGKSLRVRIDAKHQGQIVKAAEGQQLRIPLDIGPGKSTLVLEYAW